MMRSTCRLPYLARSGVPRQQAAVAVNKDEVELVYGRDGIPGRESSRFTVVAKLLSKSIRKQTLSFSYGSCRRLTGAAPPQPIMISISNCKHTYQSHEESSKCISTSTLSVHTGEAPRAGGTDHCTHLEPSREVANHILRATVLLPLDSLEGSANELVEFPEGCPPCLRARKRVDNQHSHASTDCTRSLRRFSSYDGLEKPPRAERGLVFDAFSWCPCQLQVTLHP